MPLPLPDRPVPAAPPVTPSGVGAVSAVAGIAGAAPVGDISNTRNITATHAQGATVPGAAQPSTPAAGQTTTTLSTAARTLSTWLSLGGDAVARGVAAEPLLALPDTDQPAMATALRDGIEKSGTFYESHLAAWHQGRRNLDSLRQEPQASLRPGHDNDDAFIATLVGRQLDTLETGRIHWQGELWPGLGMEWTITKTDLPPGMHAQRRTNEQGREATTDENGQSETREESAHRAWHSRLRLNLPVLGEVDAQLRLVGGQLGLTLHAARSESADLLREQHQALSGELAGAGIALETFRVQRGKE